MTLLKEDSLAATLEAVEDSLFEGRTIPAAERKRVARWLAGRQGLPGAYAGMIAPTSRDYRTGFQLFTGEWVRSKAQTGHILGEEACRTMILLDLHDPAVEEALDRARSGILEAVCRPNPPGRPAGMFCCGTCTSALVRHLAARRTRSGDRRLARGIRAIRQHRDGRGRWRRFPFYYTLLALTEAGTREAELELRYALPACKRARKTDGGKYGRRRERLLERILKSA